MKPLTWDSVDANGQPYRWDNKNLRWGSPSYVLEPGDPGYTPPSVSTPPQTKTRKRMKRQRYYPSRQADQLVWLENFRNKIGAYATALGLETEEVDALVVRCRWLIYLIGSWLPAVRAWNLACTQALKLAETGTGGPVVLPTFTPPALPSGVTAQDEGALDFIFDRVAEIKENDACTDIMCSDLRIIGSEHGVPDFNTLAPELTAVIAGNKVELGWGWSGFRQWLDQCEIHVDRGNGWQVLTFDTTPGYNDTEPFPAVLTQWKYRAIYRIDDAQVGQWSAEVSVVVG
ncbi:MAG: hypothetical protein JNJ83_16140 [Verrucomicrobiaceae bacterium]|nr:hypothetical protein [Verrucomicrobiaceae bacterium]